MSNIRVATIDDIPAILPMATKFNDRYFKIPLNLEKTIFVITWIVEEGVGFIADGGFIGGIVVDDLMRDWIILQEVAWYSTDRTGMRLLDAFIKEGWARNVNEIRLSTLSTSSPIVGKLLIRRGFTPFETSYRL